MGRSVMTYGETAVFFQHNIDSEDDFDRDMEWSDMKLNICSSVTTKFESFDDISDENSFVGNEGLILLQNELLWIVLSEYCGTAALSIMFNPEAEEYGWTGLAERQIPFVEEYLTKLIKELGYDCLMRVGRFSNGSNVYEVR